MTNQNIITLAVSLSGDAFSSPASEYATAATTILAQIYNQCATLDQAYQEAAGGTVTEWTPKTSVLATDAFPLSDVFASAVPFALASYFVSSENSELSALLYARFVARLDEIRRMIPAKSESIVDRYHLF